MNVIYFKEIIKNKGRKKNLNSIELFSLVDEFIAKNNEEYPQLALISIIMDSLEMNSDIFKIEKQLPSGKIVPLKFLDM